MTTMIWEPPENAGSSAPLIGAKVKCLICGVTCSTASTRTAMVSAWLTVRHSQEDFLDLRPLAGHFRVDHDAHVGRQPARVMVAHDQPALAAALHDVGPH